MLGILVEDNGLHPSAGQDQGTHALCKRDQRSMKEVRVLNQQSDSPDAAPTRSGGYGSLKPRKEQV